MYKVHSVYITKMKTSLIASSSVRFNNYNYPAKNKFLTFCSTVLGHYLVIFCFSSAPAYIFAAAHISRYTHI